MEDVAMHEEECLERLEDERLVKAEDMLALIEQCQQCYFVNEFDARQTLQSWWGVRHTQIAKNLSRIYLYSDSLQHALGLNKAMAVPIIFSTRRYFTYNLYDDALEQFQMSLAKGEIQQLIQLFTQLGGELPHEILEFNAIFEANCESRDDLSRLTKALHMAEAKMRSFGI